jgi:hypothetical protein
MVQAGHQAARDAGQGKYRALRGLGAHWTRVLWRCWTDHTAYDPHLHISAAGARCDADG